MHQGTSLGPLQVTCSQTVVLSLNRSPAGSHLMVGSSPCRWSYSSTFITFCVIFSLVSPCFVFFCVHTPVLIFSLSLLRVSCPSTPYMYSLPINWLTCFLLSFIIVAHKPVCVCLSSLVHFASCVYACSPQSSLCFRVLITFLVSQFFWFPILPACSVFFFLFLYPNCFFVFAPILSWITCYQTFSGLLDSPSWFVFLHHCPVFGLPSLFDSHLLYD